MTKSLRTLLLDLLDLGVARAIFYWKTKYSDAGPSECGHLPEDGEGPSEYSVQPSSSQWVGLSGPGGITGTGVWSHGAFNADDPSAPLFWEEYRLNRLRWLDQEARLLGYTLTPLPGPSTQTTSQIAYQFPFPPTPPVPLQPQPELSIFTLPEWSGGLNYRIMSIGDWTTGGTETTLPDNLQHSR